MLGQYRYTTADSTYVSNNALFGGAMALIVSSISCCRGLFSRRFDACPVASRAQNDGEPYDPNKVAVLRCELRDNFARFGGSPYFSAVNANLANNTVVNNQALWGIDG